MSSPQTNIKVGVVGYGLSARTFHIPLVKAHAELELAAVMQPEAYPDRSAGKDVSGVPIYHTMEDIVGKPELDLIVIASPSDTHHALAKDALRAGKHVVVESPMTAKSSEAEQLANLAKEKNLLLTVFHNRRYDADYLTLSRLKESGALGRIVDFESHFDWYHPDFPPKHPWKNKPMAAGGAIYEIGAHLIDQMHHLLGIPERVTAVLGSQRTQNPTGYEDFFTLLFHYPESTVATLKSTTISPEEKQLRFWVRGDLGSYKKYYHDVQEEQMISGVRPGDVGFAREPKGHHGVLSKYEDGRVTEDTYPTVNPNPTYEEFYRRLVSSIKGQEPPPVTVEDSCQVIKLVELALVSARTKRTVDIKKLDDSQRQGEVDGQR